MTIHKGGRLVLLASFAASIFVGSIAVADIISGAATTGSSNDVTFTQLTLAKPTGVSTGTLMLASIAINGGSSATTTAPAGWTQVIRTDNDTNVSLITYKKIATGQEPSSYLWQVDNQTTMQGGITPYNNVDTNNPIDAATSSIGNGTVATSPSVTSVVASSTIVSVFAVTAGKAGTAGNYFFPPTGMTRKYDTSNAPFGPSIASFNATQAVAGPSGTVSSAINSNKSLNWVSQQIVIRAITPVAENFESYSNGQNLNGANGGTGWLGPWSNVDGAVFGNNFSTSETAGFLATSNAISGLESVTASNTVTTIQKNLAIKRLIDSHTDGDIISFKMKEASNSDNKGIFVIFQGSDGVYPFTWNVSLDPGSNEVRFASGTGVQNLTPFTPNTVYSVDVQFDYTNSRARARVGGGAWSSWQVASYVETGITALWLGINDNGFGGIVTGWWDDIVISHQTL